MNSRIRLSSLFILQIAVAVLGSACILEMVGGPTVSPQPQQYIIVTATGGNGSSSLPTASPTVAPADTSTPTSTYTPTWTATPTATATSTKIPVTMTAGQTLSCVTGPHWILFEWVTSIAEGETVTLLAKATPEWGEYYYVRKADGTECWAYGGSSTKSGDLSSLPVKEAPPLPQITLTIENRTYIAVTEIQIRGKDETSWGADLLPGILGFGEIFSKTITAGFYDVRMRDTPGRVLFEKQDIAIGPEPSSRNLVYDSKYPLVIRNGTASPLREIVLNFIPGSHIDVEIPGDGILSAGEEITADIIGGCFSYFAYRVGDPALFRSGPGCSGPGASPLVII